MNAQRRETPDTVDSGQPRPTRQHWLALAVLAVGLGLIVLDGTIVGVALPAIIVDLGLTLTEAQWVNSLYAVILAALLLPTGKIADSFGRKRTFIAGMIVFGIGSALAAVATTAALLIGARAVQAVGAALIMPSTLSTVNAVFRGKYRAAAFGVWGAVISGAAAIGPLAGGMLTQWASWHWIFIVNIPLIAGLLVAAWLLVPETKGVKTRRGVDVDGGLLAAIGFGSLAFAVVEGPHRGWITASDGSGTLSIIPIVFGVALIALTLFVLWERHRDKVERDALLDLGLFRFRTFSWGNITAAMVAIGEFAIIFVLPLYLVNVLGLSVLTTGLVLSGMAIGAFCSGAAARHLAARLGAVGTALLGLVIELVGVVALVVTVTPTTPAAVITLPLVLYGLGLGLASAQLTGTVLQDVPAEVSGQASATQSTVRQIGAALGTALAGASLSTALHITLPPALAAAGVTGSAASELARATRDSAGTNLPQVNDAAIHSVLTDGFSAATQWSLLFAGVFLLVGVIGAWQLKRATAVSQRDTIRS